MRILPLASLLLLGCSSSSPVATSLTDAGAAPQAACTDLSLVVDRLDVSIQPPRDHHVTFIRNVAGKPFLYVLGGAKDEFKEFYDDVQRAAIQEDGTLLPFESAGKLPLKLAGMGLAVVGDDVLLAGGIVPAVTGGIVNSTLVGHFDANGMLSDWKDAPSIPQKVMHAAVIANGNTAYVLGGTRGSEAGDVTALFNVSGAAATLTSTGKLAGPLSHQSAWVYGSRIFMAGGFNVSTIGNPPPVATISSAAIGADGTLGAWEEVGTLPSPNGVTNATVVGCNVVTAGGLDEKRFHGRLTVTRMNAEGTIIDTVTSDAELSEPRGHVHQAPRHGKYLYVVGGRVVSGLRAVGTIDRITIESETPR